MKLVPISEHPDAARILYQLLEERDSSVNISHKKLPTWEEHCAFVSNHPYGVWYVIEGDDPGKIVGTVYMTKPPKPSVAGNEIGIFILSEYQGHGYGPRAIELLMEKHGNIRYLANIAPTNENSIKMFEKLGFKLVQHTFSLEVE